VGLSVFEPGRRWSEHVKPIAGTQSCGRPTSATSSRGRLHVTMDDGSEGGVVPGEVVKIDPGHDAWVVGGESCVMVDFAAAGNGKPA
jgi:quercetin dioxygenase-like cupin family protein